MAEAMEGTQYTTWGELIAAFQAGELPGMFLILDSNAVTLCPSTDQSDTMSQAQFDDVASWFRCHPEDAFRLLLDHVGIPWEPA